MQPRMDPLQSLVSRFGGGRVARLAAQQESCCEGLREALASATTGTATLQEVQNAGAEAAAAADAWDDYSSQAATEQHNPVPTAVEVEYSQASQQSLCYAGDGEEEGLASPCYIPGQGLELQQEATPLAPSFAPVALDSAATASTQRAADAVQPDSDDEALLLSSLLNAGGGGSSPGPQQEWQRRPAHAGSPPAVRLRRELQQELSVATDLFSPLAAVVSEHSFEEGLQPGCATASRLSTACATSPQGPAGRLGSKEPVKRTVSEAEGAYLSSAQEGAGEQEEQGEAVSVDDAAAEGSPRAGLRSAASRKAAAAPLRRAATPITAALNRQDSSSSSSSSSRAREQQPTEQVQQRHSRLGARPGSSPNPHHAADGRSGVIKPQVWSFDKIPQGRATIPIPSHALPPEQHAPGLKPHKPARPKTAACSPSGGMRPKAPAPHKQLSSPAALAAALEVGIGSGVGTQAEQVGSSTATAGGAGIAGARGLQSRSSSRRHVAGRLHEAAGLARAIGGPGAGLVAAHISAEDALQAIEQLPKQAPPAAAGMAWPPQQLQTQSQSDAAPATYSQDRFNKHLDRLTQLISQRLQQRRQQQDSMVQRVAGFQESVRAQQLGGRPASQPHTPVAAAEVDADRQQAQQQEEEEEEQEQEQQGAEVAHVPLPPEEWPLARVCVAERVPGRQSLYPRLRAVLARQQEGSGEHDKQQDPGTVVANAAEEMPAQSAAATAAAVAAEGRFGEAAGTGGHSAPAVVSELQLPGRPAMRVGGEELSSQVKVKPIMQVKGEQDLALKYSSAQQRRFRASPLPLSTMEPRFADLAQRAQQRRREAHEERLELLRSQERPFSFTKRDKQRQEAALAAAAAATSADGTGPGTKPPSETPPAFMAHPVPVSTTEARYALLVAEMQLQGRMTKRRSMTSPAAQLVRPATAQLVRRGAEVQPPRAASSLADLRFSWDMVAAASGAGTEGPASNRPEGGATEVSEAGVAAMLPPASASSAQLLAAPAPATGSSSRSLGCPGASSSTNDRDTFKAAGSAGSAILSGGAANPLWEASEAAEYSADSEWLGQPGAPMQQCSGAHQDSAAGHGSWAEPLDVASADTSQPGSRDLEQLVHGEHTGGAAEPTAPTVPAVPARSENGAASYAQQEQQQRQQPAELQGQQQQEMEEPGLDAAVDGSGALQQPASCSNIPSSGRPSCVRPGSGHPSSARTRASGSPREATTRSYQLKVRAAQEGVASGKFITEWERASLTEQDLKDMQLLCSSPKRPGAAALGGAALNTGDGSRGWVGSGLASAGPGTAPAAGTPDSRESWQLGSDLLMQKCPASAIEEGRSAAPAAATPNAVVGASTADLGQTTTSGNGALSLSAKPAAASEAGEVPEELAVASQQSGSEGEEAMSPQSGVCGIAVPVSKAGGHSNHGSDSPMSGRECCWKLGTEVTLQPISKHQATMAAGCGGDSEGPTCSCCATAGASCCEGDGSLVLGGSGSQDPNKLSSEDRLKRRDTPKRHIEARHKQAEVAAKAEVRQLLLKRGMSVYKYVEGSES